jgi:hypothetical protein
VAGIRDQCTQVRVTRPSNRHRQEQHHAGSVLLSSSWESCEQQGGRVGTDARSSNVRAWSTVHSGLCRMYFLLLLLLLFLADLSLVDTLPGEYLCGQSVIAVKAHPQVSKWQS